MSAVAAHGEYSAREVSEADRSVWKALRITLKRYHYKLQHKQELKLPDFDSRRSFANFVFNKMEEQHDWLHTVLWTEMKRISRFLALLTPTIVECGPQKIHMHLLRYPCSSLK
ncbi:transposable element tc3 transposase [Caerostris extrusa]|uniref:Transposable element tc3 transposase n=1 Tax=Caerostris extrusa TaxID=172846 RepID=A0AAV4PLT9_CAEEX|nr:transposable element tc3 transposase [Caerostris extrusa]